ncbi:MAG TPA: iron-sulfur cluster repair di-iron protein [Acidobacteriaceae bacterium]|nr:iron-sulfur cluster repair di-iron protein [Acidobacteriaceae bacterium]
MATAETTVRDIALENPAAIRVFEKFGIDYCCGGRKPLAQACEERALEMSAVLAALSAADVPAEPGGTDWSTAPLGALCEHIISKHHAYVRAEIPRLQFFAGKVAARHGETHPELLRIKDLTETICEEMTQHMGKEELVLFPYITKLERNIATCGPPSLGCFGTVRNPIRMMMAEHDAAGSIMAEMRQQSGDYTAPDGACPTYRGFYQSLAEFERDLHRHVHLENNILFPRAIELEERFI